MTETKNSVLTIGHSNRSLDSFLAHLKVHDVTALADVRSAPYSRFTPQFNRDDLRRSLKAHGINYVFLGRELGARSSDRSCYDENGRVQYARLACTDAFRTGIERVVRGAADQRIVLMCAEGEPLECHRTVLVARELEKLGLAVKHLLRNGKSEDHSATLLRLLDMSGLPRAELFRSTDELIEVALARQEERIAYVDEQVATDGATQ